MIALTTLINRLGVVMFSFLELRNELDIQPMAAYQERIKWMQPNLVDCLIKLE